MKKKFLHTQKILHIAVNFKPCLVHSTDPYTLQVSRPILILNFQQFFKCNQALECTDKCPSG